MTDGKDRYAASQEGMVGHRHEAPWLRDVLRASRSVLHQSALRYCWQEPSAEFAARCAKAAYLAAALAKLGAQRQRVGFVPLPMREYVESLAQAAQVALKPVLQWAGVDDLSSAAPQLASAWSRLAAGIGMNLPEALSHWWISVAESRGEKAFATSLARDSVNRDSADAISETEQAFRRWVRTLKPAERDELRMAEAEIRGYFESL